MFLSAAGGLNFARCTATNPTNWLYIGREPPAQMKILVINTGSASIKLAAYELGDQGPGLLDSAHFAPDEDTPDALIRHFTGKWGQSPDAVCHRVVHGGRRLQATCRITEDVLKEIARLADVAPLHNPVAQRWIEACTNVFGARTPQVGVFDTAFYAHLPAHAAHYALPRGLTDEFKLRRYGFHGTAHRAMWERWCQLRPDLDRGGRLISVQLGGGCSMTAVRDGAPVDTSMGFSPVEGLVMATRSGDIDPGIITYLMRKQGLSPEKVDTMLNKESGLKGLSGADGDIRPLLQGHDPAHRLAVDVYCYRIRKYLGAYLAVLGGADGIVFGGGVGEHAPRVREKILSGFTWCDILLDRAANEAVTNGEGRISQPPSSTEIWVTPVDEGVILAREAYEALKSESGKD